MQIIKDIMAELETRRNWENPKEVEIWFEEKLKEVAKQAIVEERQKEIEENKEPPEPTERDKFIIEYCLRNPVLDEMNLVNANYTIGNAHVSWKEVQRYLYPDNK